MSSAAPAPNPLDAYEPLDVIGNGSFGIIRKVRRKADDVVLARKELNFEKMSDRDRKQIVAEVNILKDLHHENIVRYIDRFVDRDAGILYILMEYCDGGDLSGVIKQCLRSGRPLPEDIVWSYFFQLLQALQYCHCPNNKSADEGGTRRQQILHRDVKPENVFLSGNNTVKLGDFGLSKALSHATFTHTYVGTPYYMSPELIQEKSYDSKSDIWSLGCLIYELCALRPPFADAQTHSELSALIRTGRIPPLPKGYSHSLSQVIKSMLNLNPAMRPSAQQLLQHERLEFARKVCETEKMLLTVKTHKSNLAAKERELQAYASTLAQREAEMSSVVARKDVEIEQLKVLVTQTEVRIRQTVTAREEELCTAVMRRESEVRLAMARREKEILDAVRKREVEINEAWQRREEEVRKELQQAFQWVETRQKELEEEAQDLRMARQELEQEGQRDSDPDTPIATRMNQAIPTVPGSAMRGVVLTSTGEALKTPMPFSKGSGAIGTELTSIIHDSPCVALNFRKIFDFDTSSESGVEEDGAIVDETFTHISRNTNVEASSGSNSARSRSNSSSGSKLPEPVRSLSPLKKLAMKTRKSLGSGDPDRARALPNAPPSSTERKSESGTIMQAPMTRLKRPSTTRTSSGRPSSGMPASISAPVLSSIPVQYTGKGAFASRKGGGSPSTNLSASAETDAVKANERPPTPQYDPSDEENFPSPFLKRVERISVAPVAAKASRPSTGSTVPLPAVTRRRSHGNLLRVAAANAAQTQVVVPPVAGNAAVKAA